MRCCGFSVTLVANNNPSGSNSGAASAAAGAAAASPSVSTAIEMTPTGAGAPRPAAVQPAVQVGGSSTRRAGGAQYARVNDGGDELEEEESIVISDK